MPDLETALEQLRYLCGQEQKTVQERRDLMMSGMPRDLIEDQDRLLAAQLQERIDKTAEVFQRVLEFPPAHSRHDGQLKEFHSVAPFDKSVFVMTKFPNPDPAKQTDLDRQLIRIIDAVKGSIRGIKGKDLEPRLASDKKYHPMLWDNVELYLLGCQRGVAIVEDKYRSEFNPNVAIEWGWMRGMKRDVLYLIEDDFKNERADTTGFLSERFSWDEPEPGIGKAIADWLG